MTAPEIFRGPLLFWSLQRVMTSNVMPSSVAMSSRDWAFFRTPPGAPVLRWYGVHLASEPKDAEIAVSPGEVLRLSGQVFAVHKLARPKQARRDGVQIVWRTWTELDALTDEELAADSGPARARLLVERDHYERTPFVLTQLRWVQADDQESRQAILNFADVE